VILLKYLRKIVACIFLLFVCLQVYADTSVQETARAYWEGKTVTSKHNGSKVTTTFKKNNRIFGRYNQWTSTGRYEIDKHGTMCVKWDTPGWKGFCHIYGTGAGKID